MVKHIVFWNFTPGARGCTDEENYRAIKAGLEGLVGKIDGLVSAKVSLNFNPKGYTACLEAVFRDRAALEFYQNHPEHQKVRALVHEVICGRAVVDYEEPGPSQP